MRENASIGKFDPVRDGSPCENERPDPIKITEA